jgi:polar amino acid transport system substrate-binding protein
MHTLMAGLKRAAFMAVMLASRLHAAEPPLRVGVVPNTPPFVQADSGAAPTGFSVALFQALAAEMRRDVVFTAAPLPALTDQLASGKLDVLAGPILATPERATDLLFTEGYMWSAYQFGSRAGAPMAALGDLRGKRLAVEAGSDYAGWADRNAAKYGFTVVAVSALAGVFNAVRTGQADASLTGSPALRAAVSESPDLRPGLALAETRSEEAAAVLPANVELRDEIEDAMRCLKQSGAVARLSQQWFGGKPEPEDLENMVIPGYGIPDLAGFDPKPRKSHCQP